MASCHWVGKGDMREPNDRRMPKGVFMSDDAGEQALDAVLVEPVPSPGKPRVWTVFVAVVLATVANIGFSVVVIVFLVANAVGQGMSPQEAAKQIPEMIMDPKVFTVLILCGGLACGLGAIIPAWLSPMPTRERLGLPGVKVPGRVYVLAILGSILPLAIALGFAQALTLVIPPDESFQMLFDKMTIATAVLFVLSIAIFPGVSEELLFRGYVQGRLLQRWSPIWAIGVTSVVFALAHIQPHTVVAAFPLGIYFGYLSWRCGSIGPSILCHAFVNGGLNAWRAVVKFGEVPETAQIVLEVFCVLVGVVCFVLLVRQFGARVEGPDVSWGEPKNVAPRETG